MASSTTRTRLLIISDTHGHALLDPAHDGTEASHQYGFRRPLPPADIALHCGDLTLRSTPKELETTLNLMREIDAPLKLVIPGNHDMSLDLKFWEEEECRRKERFLSPTHMAALRRVPEECAALIQKARQQDGIHVLIREGTYHFTLPLPPPSNPNAHDNCGGGGGGAKKFTIFTSPWTPAYGRWGFQYDPDIPGAAISHFALENVANPLLPSLGTQSSSSGGHHLDDDDDDNNNEIDVIMTHGPPFGVLDATKTGEKVGCAYLLDAVARARPQVHCFGHIHESAGAALLRWGEDVDDVDDAVARAELVTTAASGSQLDQQTGGIRPLNLCAGNGDGIGFEVGKQTLFVNAAIMTVRYKPLQSPWLVDLDLPLADDTHKAKAEATRVLLTS